MAGYTINQLARATSVSGGDLVPVFVTDSGGAQAAPMSVVRTYVLDDLGDTDLSVATLTTSGVVNVGGNLKVGADIVDANGKKILGLFPVASAVNYLLLANAATGGNVEATAAGADANIGLVFTSKGTGDAILRSAGGDTTISAVSGDINLDASAGNVIADVANLHTFAVRVAGVQQIGLDNVLADFNVPVKPRVYTVGTLPSAVTVGQGARAFVTDSNAAIAAGLGNTVAAGGANKVPVYSDGTDWRIG